MNATTEAAIRDLVALGDSVVPNVTAAAIVSNVYRMAYGEVTAKGAEIVLHHFGIVSAEVLDNIIVAIEEQAEGDEVYCD